MDQIHTLPSGPSSVFGANFFLNLCVIGSALIFPLQVYTLDDLYHILEIAGICFCTTRTTNFVGSGHLI